MGLGRIWAERGLGAQGRGAFVIRILSSVIHHQIRAVIVLLRALNSKPLNRFGFSSGDSPGRVLIHERVFLST